MAKVLSTTRIRAVCVGDVGHLAIETTCNMGLLGVSTQSILVESVNAAARASGSLRSTDVDSDAPLAKDAGQQSIGAAVGVVAQDHVIARRERS